MFTLQCSERVIVVRGHIISQRVLRSDDSERFVYAIVECDDCSPCVCARIAKAKRSKCLSRSPRVFRHVAGPWMPFATVVAHVSLLCHAIDDDPKNGVNVARVCDVRIPEKITLFTRGTDRNGTCFLSYMRVELERTCNSDLDWFRVIENLTRDYVGSVDRRGTITHFDMSHLTSFLTFLRKRLSEGIHRTKKRPPVVAEEELAKAMIRNLRQRVRWLPDRLLKRQYARFALEHDRHRADMLVALYTTNTFRTFLSTDDFTRYVDRVHGNRYEGIPRGRVPDFHETLLYDDEDVRSALGLKRNARTHDASCDAAKRWELLTTTRDVRIEVSVTRYGPNDRAHGRAHTECFPLTSSKIDRAAQFFRSGDAPSDAEPPTLRTDRLLVIDARNALIRVHVHDTDPTAHALETPGGRVHILITTAWTDDTTFTACADIVERVFHPSLSLLVKLFAWDNEALVHGPGASKRTSRATRRFLTTHAHDVEAQEHELDAVVALASLTSLRLGVERTKADEASRAWLNRHRVHVTNAISEATDRFTVGEWALNTELGIAGRIRAIRDAHTGERLRVHEREILEEPLSKHARVMLLEVLWNEDTLEKELDMYFSLSDTQWRACRACPCLCAHQLPVSCAWTDVTCHIRGRAPIEDTPQSNFQAWGWLPVCAGLLQRCREQTSSPSLTLTHNDRHGEREEDTTLFFLHARADVAYANLHDKTRSVRLRCINEA
ncbi:hypothetical protein CYMTET_35607 [Cymbomonas tetramitiformis]|uniref:Uncharacterized protein n=1 Tax=Cymbomonas tetramitiformis TaxID=36881 RepID=A0AAE0F8T5_9CHLO|nr:hypothetical protein CYMTET_35607 [Cymbomonas tetramitiformis]|eukprot:gene15-22_t